MFSFLRENVLRPHCPQCAFHCLEPPQVSFSYFRWLRIRRGSNFSPKVMLFQSALISDRLALSAYTPIQESHIILAFSLVYSGKNQFGNSVTGRNVSLRLGFCFQPSGNGQQCLAIPCSSTHIWAGVTRLRSYCPAELFFFFFAQVILN